MIYFDTEHAFSSQRLTELVRARHPRLFETPQQLVPRPAPPSLLSLLEALLLNRVHVVQVTSTAGFLLEVERLEEEVIGRNVRLIVVDSIAALVRKDFERQDLGRRQATLSKLAQHLKALAEQFHLPVLVSNQVALGGTPGSSSYVTAALGTLWLHAVNTRLVLEWAERPLLPGARQLIIAKSPVSPVVSFPFLIDAQGICLIKRPGTQEEEGQGEGEDPLGDYPVELLAGNFWDKLIAARPPAHPRH